MVIIISALRLLPKLVSPDNQALGSVGYKHSQQCNLIGLCGAFY